ncbi:MAG: hydrogenase formation protein HypD [bacterium]|nr:hydrogenase formation protein HypD [bacterium]
MKKDTIKKLADALKNRKLDREIRIMEVCGTHTVEFFKSGVKDIFPEGLILVDGPGCPVCVTANDYLDRAIEIGKEYKPIIATFGDMIKVPSSYSSLGKEIAAGMDIRVVYSPLEAITLAEENPDREVIFLSVGFETTAPTESATVLEAEKRNVKNFSLLSCNKLTPPAVEALLAADEVKIDGFIIPGHVSAVIGSNPWKFIPEKYNKPSVVAGFDPEDLITGVLMLLELFKNNTVALENEYKKIVKEEGNVHAIDLMYKVFEKADAHWRGIGVIPNSGLSIREEYAAFDAVKKFPVTVPEPKEAPGCRCGDLLRGLIAPTECPLFGTACTPEHAVGPCMVSFEGPCSAYYKYGHFGSAQ